MLVIRLRRTGKKKKPSFRVIVAEKTMPIYGRFVDIIGNVNLQSDPKVININKEKALDWIKKGAKPSHSVARLMVKQGILKEEDVKMNPEKKRPKKKEMKKEEPAKEATAETATAKDAKEAIAKTAKTETAEIAKETATAEVAKSATKEVKKGEESAKIEKEKPVEKQEKAEIKEAPTPAEDEKGSQSISLRPTNRRSAADHSQGEKSESENAK